MQNMTASVPHQLTRAEAKRRIEEGIAKFRSEHGAMLHDLKETWNGDRMDFSAGAMGQSISGHLLVEDKAIAVEVALPWLLNLLAGPLKQQIEQRGQKLLGGA